ncbi:hypothetical protein QEP16_23410 [Achromobacter insolitus]|nr:hypothetical protein [Achromobacter insolitus]MCP1405165.1 hypothetical protein [Achromobacter insolitus]MDH3066290.1 hypothetical protein [Achromobacter insolitus]
MSNRSQSNINAQQENIKLLIYLNNKKISDVATTGLARVITDSVGLALDA